MNQNWSLNHMDTGGNGDVVVLLHGLAGDHKAWAPQIEALRDRYRVIAFDNPGSGQSPPVTAPTDLKSIAASVLANLDVLGVKAFHLVGRSMGGGIAQEMALAAPDRVRTLALAGSFVKLDALGIRLIENMRNTIVKDRDWANWTRLFSFTFVSNAWFLADPERTARLEAIIADESRDVTSYVHLANACLAHNSVGRLRDLALPLLVMAGRQDPICSPLTTGWIIEEQPAARLAWFEESSHFFLMEEAPAVNRLLGEWFGAAR